MTDQSSDTKNKILETAKHLFSDQGFEGTSIRDISKKAEVNLASINYHFSSKEKLFSEVLKIGYLECSSTLNEMYKREDPTLEDALIFLFRYFTEESHNLINFFKMMMSTQHSRHVHTQGTEDEFLGPPGGKRIAESICKEVGGHVSEEDLHWALKCLFGHVIHTSIIYNCCFKHNQVIPFSTDPDIEKNIRRLTRVVLEDLRKKA